VEMLDIASYFPTGKESSFITLYKKWKVIASCWKIHASKAAGAEFYETCLHTIDDPRWAMAQVSADQIESLQIRVDIVAPEHKRILSDIQTFQPRTEGLIFLSEWLQKISVLLPQIVPGGKSSQELMDILFAKAWITTPPPEQERYIYAFTTQAYTNF
jgi:hypothetical protein